ncbi:hypothetical protein J1N35_043454, partial [Gossypium stocksii]
MPIEMDRIEAPIISVTKLDMFLHRTPIPSDIQMENRIIDIKFGCYSRTNIESEIAMTFFIRVTLR